MNLKDIFIYGTWHTLFKGMSFYTGFVIAREPGCAGYLFAVTIFRYLFNAYLIHAGEALCACVSCDVCEYLLGVLERLCAGLALLAAHAVVVDAAHPARAVAAAVALVPVVVPLPALVHVAVQEPRAVEVRPRHAVAVPPAGDPGVVGDALPVIPVAVEGEGAEDPPGVFLAAAAAAAAITPAVAGVGIGGGGVVCHVHEIVCAFFF